MAWGLRLLKWQYSRFIYSLENRLSNSYFKLFVTQRSVGTGDGLVTVSQLLIYYRKSYTVYATHRKKR